MAWSSLAASAAVPMPRTQLGQQRGLASSTPRTRHPPRGSQKCLGVTFSIPNPAPNRRPVTQTAPASDAAPRMVSSLRFCVSLPRVTGTGHVRLRLCEKN